MDRSSIVVVPNHFPQLLFGIGCNDIFLKDGEIKGLREQKRRQEPIRGFGLMCLGYINGAKVLAFFQG